MKDDERMKLRTGSNISVTWGFWSDDWWEVMEIIRLLLGACILVQYELEHGGTSKISLADFLLGANDDPVQKVT